MAEEKKKMVEAVASNAAYEAETDTAYEAAKELAESYPFLLKEKEFYQKQMGNYARYTLADAVYLLSQGAHEQTERVQTSGISDPVFRAASGAEKLMNRLNVEQDAAYRKEVLEPYWKVCEKIRLFEVCMNLLEEDFHHIAEQLYVKETAKKDITDLRGEPISRKVLDRAISFILKEFARVLVRYKNYCPSDGRNILTETGENKTN